MEAKNILFDDSRGDEPQQVSGQIIDSSFFGNGYGTPEAREIFSDLRRLQRWLDVEAALCASQADLGLIPEDAASELQRTAKLQLIDLASVREGIKNSGHSLVPLLKAWQAINSDEAGQFIHFGATTQDIQDTAQSLEIRDAIELIERDFKIVITKLARLAEQNKDVVIVGRTHGQQALPTTLGLKFASWLDEALRNYERLQSCKKSVLVSQLFGGVGTMAAFGDQGKEILQRFSARLGLSVPITAWHNARDRIVDFVCVLALVTGNLAKIANEIIQLNKNEIGELAEPFKPGQVGSSTMPHKRNPELSERVVLLGKIVKSHASLGFDSLGSEHERDYRTVRLEWVTVTDSVLCTCCALDLMKYLLAGLVVNHQRIEENVERAAEMICTEALMFELGKKLGKQNAHEIIYKASMRSVDSGESLIDVMLTDVRVARHFDQQALKKLVTPANHTGLSAILVEDMLAHTNTLLV